MFLITVLTLYVLFLGMGAGFAMGYTIGRDKIKSS